MNIIKFRTNLMNLLCNSENEAQLHALRCFTRGLSGVKTAKIINYASRCCYANECYVEIGVYTGFTLCAAGYQNVTHCIGIDDFSLDDFYDQKDPEQVKKVFRDSVNNNIAHIRNPNIQFIEADFRNVALDLESGNNKKIKSIGVLYLDGCHTTEQTIEGFKWAEPMLSDDAVIILDDSDQLRVEKAVGQIILEGNCRLLIHAIHTRDPHMVDVVLDEGICTGLTVLHYKRIEKKVGAEC